MCIRDRPEPFLPPAAPRGRSPPLLGLEEARPPFAGGLSGPVRSGVGLFTAPSCLPRHHDAKLKSAEIAQHPRGAEAPRGCLYVRRRPTLPQVPTCSTIGAERLSFRVRNGAGRFPLAMITETLWSYGGSAPSAKKARLPTVARELHSGRVTSL